MKTEYRPIAMRCTQEQFDSIKDRIPLRIKDADFKYEEYLVNNRYGKEVVSSCFEFNKMMTGREVYETFDGELFLDCCGREKGQYKLIGECKGNDGNGCFMDSCGHDCGCFTEEVIKEKDYFVYVNQEQKDTIIKEYLKDKVWKGSELQYREDKNKCWKQINDYDVRIKPQPDYSKEIEALEQKAKENGQKVKIKIELCDGGKIKIDPKKVIKTQPIIIKENFKK